MQSHELPRATYFAKEKVDGHFTSPKQFLISSEFTLISKMHTTPLFSLAAVAMQCSALVVPLEDANQASLRGWGKNSKGYNLDPSAKYAFAGITTFAQLPQAQCLLDAGPVDEILVLGFPFDTATSYRTGTRLGPNAIRQGSRAASLASVWL